MVSKLKEIVRHKWFQLAAMLFIGITIGAVFYPQSNIKEKYKEEFKAEFALKEQELNKQHSEKVSELTEKLSVLETSSREKNEETQYRLQKLTQENQTLKQSIKKQKLKIIKPDGTIVEKELEESNTEATKNVITQVKEEFNRKIQEIENKWKTIHQERVAKLKEEYDLELKKAREEHQIVEKTVEKEKIVETNPKKLRPEIGLTTDKDVYLHGTYNVWGPVFLGGGVSGTDKSFGEARFGVGLEF